MNFCFRCHESKTRAKIKNDEFFAESPNFALFQKLGIFQKLKID